MTRILRTSCWIAMDKPPITVVCRDSDTNDSLEATRVKVEEPGVAFYTHDLFESESTDPTIEEATFEAMARFDPLYEQHKATLFFYLEMVCMMLTPGGLWAAPDPAPLKVQDIVYVFNRAVERPWYKNQILQTRTEDGFLVSVVNGEIKVGDG